MTTTRSVRNGRLYSEVPSLQVLIPLFTGQPLPSEKLQEVMEGLSTSLKQFEERFLKDKAFIVGSEISLADLVAIVELMQVSAGVW